MAKVIFRPGNIDVPTDIEENFELESTYKATINDDDSIIVQGEHQEQVFNDPDEFLKYFMMSNKDHLLLNTITKAIEFKKLIS